MTADAMRVKIGIEMGWQCKQPTSSTPCVEMWQHPSNMEESELPDYPNDLNACHEFEGKMTSRQRYEYCQQLSLKCYPIVDGKWPEVEVDLPMWFTTHANAAQRCEAFCRMMGWWEE